MRIGDVFRSFVGSNNKPTKSAHKRNNPAFNRRFSKLPVISLFGYRGFPRKDYSRTNDEDNSSDS